MKHIARLCVVTLVTATLLAVFMMRGYAATPDGDFDLWLAETHAYLAELEHSHQASIVMAEIELAVAQADIARIEAEMAAAAARRTIPPQAATSPVSVDGGSGDCYASSLPSYIVDRESGGNASAYNASGAWGCFQFMPGTWNANCSDIGAYGSAPANVQVECANRVSNGGTNLNPWR